MKIIALMISCFYFYNVNLNEQKQTLVYDLKVSGNAIGKVTATKTINHNQTIYTSNTDATVNMLVNINIKTRMKVIFEDGKLIESDYKFYKNDKLKETATISYKEGKYIITHDGVINEMKSPITKSTIMLPFYMPLQNEKIFEEVEGNYKVMKLINQDNYKLIEPQTNHQDDYFYKNGIMKSCLIRNTLVNFEMILKSE